MLVVVLELMKKNKKINAAGSLSVRLAAIGSVEGGKLEVTRAQNAVKDIGNSAAVSGLIGVANTITTVQTKAGDIESSLGILISKIDIIVRVGDKLAKV